VQSGASIILNLCRYDFMFPLPVTIVFMFCVKIIFVCRLSATVGKYSYVVLPFFVVSHSFCQVTLLFTSSSHFMALFGILLKLMCISVLLDASFASLSASSLPVVP